MGKVIKVDENSILEINGRKFKILDCSTTNVLDNNIYHHSLDYRLVISDIEESHEGTEE